MTNQTVRLRLGVVEAALGDQNMAPNERQALLAQRRDLLAEHRQIEHAMKTYGLPRAIAERLIRRMRG